MLSVSNLHVAVGDTPVLKGLTLDVPAGEVHVVTGPTGGGHYDKMLRHRRTV
ncbi:Fe-S cluster assembly ATPase SufC [Brevundimonas halotolerans]|uniref:Fe-S cluster assembly ATPase SufC n=1 Tax=Brevundimonas halotolerans TaxID=69670 RepID=A0A7W9A1K4_9CAUL|nr:Fe-S cluster assembly ATPase SufC [Brevundimonas halotolerans]